MRLRWRIADRIHSFATRTGRPYRVVSPEHLHITTHFVGEVTEKSLGEIRRSFQRSRLPFQSRITLGETHTIGMFGKDILYLPVEDPTQLLHSLKKEGQRIAPVRETHSVYTPHFTVVRNPKGGNGILFWSS
jgi:2'-5' RNA ligase